MSISQEDPFARFCVSPRLIQAFLIFLTFLLTASAALGATLVVPAGGDLQAAINSATPGDTIVLDAGATYSGPFTLVNKSGDSYITIQSSRASEITGRVTPAQSALLAKLRSNLVAEPVIKTASSAHHYKLIGLDISTVAATDFVYDLVRLGSDTQTDLSMVPHHFILDRLWVHGFASQDLSRGIALNTAESSVLNSYISDIHSIETEAQAICVWNGPGPFHIINNYLEASGENIMFGGADPAIQNLVPADIEIRGNYLFKPLSWKVGDPSYLGRHWLVKNILELKNAKRVTIDGNILQNNWVDGQAGTPVLFTARNQGGNAPWCVVQDVVFSNNTVTNTQGGVNILRTDWESRGAITTRVTITNNIFDKIGNFNAFQLLNGPNDIQITHNTVFKGGNIFVFDADPGNPKGTGLVIRDNLFSEGGYGVFGSNIGEGTPALDGYFVGYTFLKNNAAGRESYMYPAGTTVVPTAQVGFTDYVNGNYRLTSTSQFKNAATDGKDVGVDVDALLAAQNSTTPNPTPTPTPNPTPTPTPNPTPTPTPTPTPVPTPTPAPSSSIQFASASYTVSENAGYVTLTIVRTGNLASTASVNYATQDGTASSVSDYGAAAGMLTFLSGESSKALQIAIKDDAISESDETFRVLLSNITNANTGTPATATVTISDNDKPGKGKLPRTGIVIN